MKTKMKCIFIIAISLALCISPVLASEGNIVLATVKDETGTILEVHSHEALSITVSPGTELTIQGTATKTGKGDDLYFYLFYDDAFGDPWQHVKLKTFGKGPVGHSIITTQFTPEVPTGVYPHSFYFDISPTPWSVFNYQHDWAQIDIRVEN